MHLGFAISALLEGIDTKENTAFIEECINRQVRSFYISKTYLFLICLLVDLKQNKCDSNSYLVNKLSNEINLLLAFSLTLR